MKILFHLPGDLSSGIYVEDGAVPNELYYGSDALADQHTVDRDEQRFGSLLQRLPKRMRRNGLGIPNFTTIRKIFVSDLLIIKDIFSIAISLIAKIAGTPVLYVDSMFEPPRNWLTKAIFKCCISWSFKTVSYSGCQNEVWIGMLGVAPEKLDAFPFCIDFAFYDKYSNQLEPRGNDFIAVGRDTGRDYPFLIEVFDRLEANLNLVTMKYLLEDANEIPKNVKVYESISYEELTELYSRSAAHIVPLKEAYTYPSGIRAVLESFALGVPVIVSRTPVLEEYFPDYVGFIGVGDSSAMRQTILNWSEISADQTFTSTFAYAREHYDYRIYCSRLCDLVDSVESQSK